MHGSDDVVEIDKAKVETEGNVTIKVEVLNGCGKEGIGIEVTKLRDKGFDVINCENTPGFNYEHTLILTVRDSEKASKVGKTLGVKRKNKINVNESALVDVTVV